MSETPNEGRPRLLDAFCGAGGATAGYQRAGFYVVGVDIASQPNYCGDEFIKGDALKVLASIARDDHGLGSYFDAAAASPPCQAYANVTRWRGSQGDHPELIPETRRLLEVTGLPWVIENVENAPIRPDVKLCGSMFGLPVRRHRWFETSWGMYELRPSCQHSRDDLAFMHKGERAYADAMGCGWMTSIEGRQAIPPAYTEYIGSFLIAEVDRGGELVA